MNRIVLIDNEPLTIRRKELFYIDRFIDDGFEFQFWDLSSFFSASNILPDRVHTPYTKLINNNEQLKYALSLIDKDDTIFIVEAVKNDFSYPIYKELAKQKCRIARLNLYSNVILMPTGKKRVIDLKCIKNLINRVINYIKWYPIKLEVFLSPKVEKKITGFINHPDFNDCKFLSNESLLDYPYIVFCDSCFPHHPDEKGITDHLSKEKYYTQMCSLFDYLEEKFNLPIVIAAHPKSNYSNEFGSRLIIKYETRRLVLNASKVIIHNSNSISYATIADKEILCVATDDMLSIKIHRLTLNGINKMLGISILNIDRTAFDNLNFERILPKLRNEYIYKYLTKPEVENKDNYLLIKSAFMNL